MVIFAADPVFLPHAVPRFWFSSGAADTALA
jgi:hypothetical protein